jgi:hypothetical protein
MFADLGTAAEGGGGEGDEEILDETEASYDGRPDLQNPNNVSMSEPGRHMILILYYYFMPCYAKMLYVVI